MGRNILISISILVCLISLLLPTTCDDTMLPSALQLAVHQKLFASYLLGKLHVPTVAYLTMQRERGRRGMLEATDFKII